MKIQNNYIKCGFKLLNGKVITFLFICDIIKTMNLERFQLRLFYECGIDWVSKVIDKSSCRVELRLSVQEYVQKLQRAQHFDSQHSCLAIHNLQYLLHIHRHTHSRVTYTHKSYKIKKNLLPQHGFITKVKIMYRNSQGSIECFVNNLICFLVDSTSDQRNAVEVVAYKVIPSDCLQDSSFIKPTVCLSGNLNQQVTSMETVHQKSQSKTSKKPNTLFPAFTPQAKATLFPASKLTELIFFLVSCLLFFLS